MSKTIKSVFDAMDDIKGVLVSSNIPSSINGEIRIAQRRLDSTKEDIVINSLLYDADQKQSGIFNVNIYVPNLSNQTAENPTSKDNTQPNKERFSEIGEDVVKALDNYHGHDFSIQLRNPGELDNYGTKWLYNIEIRYSYLRTDIV